MRVAVSITLTHDERATLQHCSHHRNGRMATEEFGKGSGDFFRLPFPLSTRCRDDSGSFVDCFCWPAARQGAAASLRMPQSVQGLRRLQQQQSE